MVPGLIDSPVQPGDVIDDKYIVDAVIGVGGMGVVVSAKHAELGQRVALKFLLPHAAGVPGAVERFIREARSAVQLQSQHVARVYDVGRIDGGTPYLVMELLEGCDLGTLVKNSGPLRTGDVAEFVIQACEAVAEAHALGIVHRDLKPANLFLTRRVNGAPLVKVLDFGISKVTNLLPTDASLTKTSDVVGSPYYMSPEQVRSAKDVDARSDIWALGVVLYELLAGQVPFAATNVPQLCAKVLEAQPLPLMNVRAEIPEGLSRIVSKCLAKQPADRFASVQDLVRALAPYVDPNIGANKHDQDTFTAELPPLPVRSSMTLGQTVQSVLGAAASEHSVGGPGGSQPLVLVQTPNNSERVPLVQPVGVLERSANLAWDNGHSQGSIRRSWLLWAVPIVGAVVALVIIVTLWVSRDGLATVDSASSAVSAVQSGEVPPAISPAISPATSATADLTALVVAADSVSDSASSTPRVTRVHKATAPAATKTTRPPATNTAIPPVKGTSKSGGDNSLPSDRK